MRHMVLWELTHSLSYSCSDDTVVVNDPFLETFSFTDVQNWTSSFFLFSLMHYVNVPRFINMCPARDGGGHGNTTHGSHQRTWRI